MRTAIKILGLVGAVSGIIALKRRADNKRVEGNGHSKDLKQPLVAAKDNLKGQYDDFLNEAEKFIDHSVQKIKSFNKSIGDKANDLDERTKSGLNEKIAKITVVKDEISTKIREFKSSAEDKKDALKKAIETNKEALSKSLDSFEKDWD